MELERPPELFDREVEWAELSRFLSDRPERVTLGVVSGRRRQGKSFLLQHLSRAAGGFYFCATQGTEADNLRALAESLAEFERRPATRFDSWRQALDLLIHLGRQRPVPIVLDEFPYLCAATPSLPGMIQAVLDREQSESSNSHARLILCGSSLTFMGSLLSGTAPLRGRAGLELIVHSFDYRAAARFWGADDPAMAAKLHATVGGTPAYRREFVADDAPDGPEDFDRWMLDRVLSPSSPLYREGRYLLAEDSDMRDIALYHSVLGAIVEGSATRGGIASRIGRKSDTLRHPLSVLEDAGFIRRDRDAFKANRPQYRITEPFLRFHHAILARLAASRGAVSANDRAARLAFWQANQDRFASAVLGYHFETLCRSWMLTAGASTRFGGWSERVSSAVVNDPANRSSIEVDVVAHGVEGQLLAVGEAKWHQRIGLGHLERLANACDLLASKGIDTSDCALALFGGAGFVEDLVKTRRVGDRPVVVVDLAELYAE